MNVRNWWISTRNDGSETSQSTGPQRPDGGFTTLIAQRDNGQTMLALGVYGFVRSDGTLHLEVYNAAGEVIHTFDTKR